MNFLELAKKRYAVRKYTAQPVEPEKVRQILEAGRVAPTGGNLQPQRLIVVQQREGLAKLRKAANIYQAPLAVIVCTDTAQTWTRPQDGKKLTDIDASIVTDHMMLQATELGLAVCGFAGLIKQCCAKNLICRITGSRSIFWHWVMPMGRLSQCSGTAPHASR